MKKTCSKCELTKEITMFYKSVRRIDGHSSHCKACNGEYQKKSWRKKSRREYYLSSEGKAYKEKYNNSLVGKEANLRAVRKYRDKYPEKTKAGDAVQGAVRLGKLSRINTQECNNCGSQAQNYHHPSYAKEDRLNVIPLCLDCHWKEHGRVV